MKGSGQENRSGIVLVDKPQGVTSHALGILGPLDLTEYGALFDLLGFDDVVGRRGIDDQCVDLVGIQCLGQGGVVVEGLDVLLESCPVPQCMRSNPPWRRSWRP